MKYLLLDVSGTILHKPTLFKEIIAVLDTHNINLDIKQLGYNHKLLSESIKFPDRTNLEFYNNFNSELLYSLGIVPSKELLESIFKACSYLPWKKYSDCNVLQELDLPMGILSNFNNSLEKQLSILFGDIFKDVIVSEKVGVSKPSIDFYKYALEKIGLEPSDIIYIGDSFKLDYQPAKSLGFNTYIVDRDGYYKNNKNVIHSLNELKSIVQ